MSHFLQNLIDRHQEVEGRGEVSHVVQPRPKSRFEMNTVSAFFVQQANNTGAEFTPVTRTDLGEDLDVAQTDQSQHDQSTSQIKTADSRLSSRPAPVPTPAHHQPEKPVTQSFFKDQRSDLNEQIQQVKNVIQQPKQKKIKRESLRKLTDNKNNKQTDSQQKFSNRPTQFSDEFSQRVQTTRRHLKDQQSQPSSEPRAIESPHETGKLPETHNYAPASEINQRIQTTLHRLNHLPTQPEEGRKTNELQAKSIASTNDNALSKKTNQHGQSVIKDSISQHPLHADAQRIIESQRGPEIAAESNNNASAAEFNQRIQSILHRLNSQQPLQADGHAVNESPHEAATKADPNALTNSAALPRIADQHPVLVQPAVTLKEQLTEREPEQRETRQSGLMQIPGWLTEMQANLNQRWQQLNNKAQPEPVINVTIGRVEVKAVQSETVKKTKARHKPSGVMGLDEYLKQRESRGRR